MNSRFAVRLYRAGIVIAIACLLYQQQQWFRIFRTETPSIEQARSFFSAAARLELKDPTHRILHVLDSSGGTIGALLTTAPEANDIIGYSGPNNLLVALDTNGAVAGVSLLTSADTPEHVELVRKNSRFFETFVGWKPGLPFPTVEGVAGATLTSYAIIESLQRRLSGVSVSMRFPEPVTLDEIRGVFTNAYTSVADQRRLRVLDRNSKLLGYVVRTSPQADNVSGYRGPTDALVGLGPDGRTVLGIRLRKSYDTPSYVDQIREDDTYLNSFGGRTIEDLAALDYKREKIEGVSGATETSFAIAEGLKRRFASDLGDATTVQQWRPSAHDWGLAAVTFGAAVMCFTRLRGVSLARWLWQALLIGYVGLLCGDLVSLSLLSGWAMNGIAARAAPGLVLLVMASLFVPFTARRHLYCHHICPHGAAQQWIGLLHRRRRAGTAPALPGPDIGSAARGRYSQGLRVLPFALLCGAVLSLLVGFRWDLSQIEPFDAWSWRAAPVASVVLLIAGLIASWFVPQAYCRYGCPTGALFSFLRSTGSADRFTRRDAWAGAFLIAAVLATAAARSATIAGHQGGGSSATNVVSIQGRTMGTTWTVKVRGAVRSEHDLRRLIAAEYDRIEALTSHWRTNTVIAEFNRSRTTVAFPVPSELATLCQRALEISRTTDGAFDVTVGPLVKLWGFGPAPRRSTPPDDNEIAAIRKSVGFEKLSVSASTLGKSDPAAELDLSAIVPGWANDRIAALLEHHGYTNYLVESGGELRARAAWPIAIEHPARGCTLVDESIGTSGTYRQKWVRDGKNYSHLIDPRTGKPICHNTVSVSVRLPDCASADAWAAAFNVMGVEAGLPLAERLGYAAQFVTEDSSGACVVHQTSHWK